MFLSTKGKPAMQFQVQGYLNGEKTFAIDSCCIEQLLGEVIYFLDRNAHLGGWVSIRELKTYGYDPQKLNVEHTYQVKDAQSFMDWITNTFRCDF